MNTESITVVSTVLESQKHKIKHIYSLYFFFKITPFPNWISSFTFLLLFTTDENILDAAEWWYLWGWDVWEMFDSDHYIPPTFQSVGGGY